MSSVLHETGVEVLHGIAAGRYREVVAIKHSRTPIIKLYLPQRWVLISMIARSLCHCALYVLFFTVCVCVCVCVCVFVPLVGV